MWYNADKEKIFGNIPPGGKEALFFSVLWDETVLFRCTVHWLTKDEGEKPK